MSKILVKNKPHSKLSRKDTNPKLLFGACLVCFLVVGIPYWIIPYKETNLPSSLSDIALILVAAAAFYVRIKDAIDFWMGASFIGATVPGVVILRVIVETIKDPASHNLWPFEVIIAAFFGYAYALGGSAAAALYSKLFNKSIRTRT